MLDNVLQRVAEQLSRARTASGRSLDDIAAATRINRKFLEDIENGIVPPLPETYLRAFIRSFAQELGFDGDEMIKEASESEQAVRAVPGEEPLSIRQQVTSYRPPATPARSLDSSRAVTRHQAKVLIGIAVVVVIGLLISLTLLRRDRTDRPVQEISFTDAVKEQTAKQLAATGHVDTTRQTPPPQPKPAVADTLLLEIVTSDSSWMTVVLDGGKPREYTFPPRHKMKWKAKESFVVSTGNPSAVSFTLNGKKLGYLAPGSKPVKNITLSRKNLE